MKPAEPAEYLIVGLPGTGKTLLSLVLESFGLDLGDTPAQQAMTYISKKVLEQAWPGEYPYYIPYRIWYPTELSFEHPAPPQVTVLPFVAATPAFVGEFRPTYVCLCIRQFRAWDERTKEAERERKTDTALAYASMGPLTEALKARYQLLTFNVDTKRLRGDWGHPELTVRVLAERMAELTKENPRLGW